MTGRPPLGKQAMTAAERQRRRRKKLAKQKSSNQAKALRAIARQKNADSYMPVPPGITFWRRAKVRLDDGCIMETSLPIQKPLASCETTLDDDDVLALIRRLGAVAKRRGILSKAKAALESGGGDSGVMIVGDDDVSPDDPGLNALCNS
jgi:hypothetical protein